MGGASGSIYGIRLLEQLKNKNHEVHLIVSSGAKRIIEHETELKYDVLVTKADIFYENNDLFAGPASGSFELDAMVIVPCSMKTLSAIANGYGDTLSSRAASCFLKEGRNLILVMRETPLDLAGIQNMLKAKQDGARIVPAMPAFYYSPKTIDDMVDFMVGKIFDQLGIAHFLYDRWK
jgi:flavin prenyltransferase